MFKGNIPTMENSQPRQRIISLPDAVFADVSYRHGALIEDEAFAHVCLIFVSIFVNMCVNKLEDADS